MAASCSSPSADGMGAEDPHPQQGPSAGARGGCCVGLGAAVGGDRAAGQGMWRGGVHKSGNTCVTFSSFIHLGFVFSLLASFQ